MAYHFTNLRKYDDTFEFELNDKRFCTRGSTADHHYLLVSVARPSRHPWSRVITQLGVDQIRTDDALIRDVFLNKHIYENEEAFENMLSA